MPNIVTSDRKDSDPLPYPLLFASNYRRNFIGAWGHQPVTVRRDANKCSAPNNVPFGVFPATVWPKASLYQSSFDGIAKPKEPPKTHAERLFASIVAPNSEPSQMENAGEAEMATGATKLSEKKSSNSRVRRACQPKSQNIMRCDAFNQFELPTLPRGIPYTFAGVQALRRLAEIHKVKTIRQQSQSQSHPVATPTSESTMDDVETITIPTSAAPAQKELPPRPASASTMQISMNSDDYKGVRDAWLTQSTNHYRRKRPALRETQNLVSLQNSMRHPWHK